MEVIKHDRCYDKVHDPMGPPNAGAPCTLSRGIGGNLQLELTYILMRS